MSHRLSARRRLDLALQVIGLAFDQDGISIDGAAATLGVDPGVIVDVIEPFTDLEYVHTSGSLLDDIGHVVAIDGDEIYVQSNWMQDLASLTPGDAALLLAMIETAGAIEGLNVEAVRSLRRSLDAITHVTVSDPVPPSVSQLLGAKHQQLPGLYGGCQSTDMLPLLFALLWVGSNVCRELLQQQTEIIMDP